MTAMVIAFLLSGCGNTRNGNPKVLVFTKTSGFVHPSIPSGIKAVQELGKANNFEVDTTSNGAYFEEEALKQYAAIIFLSTTGDVLNNQQEAVFERYIQAGGGFVGVHAATDTEYDWNWYGKLVGAYFQSHPNGTPEATFTITDNTFGATSFFTETQWTRKDELYNFKKINPDVKVLLTVDESTYEGGENGDNHPMSWYHEYDGGRSFYTALGHTEESYTEENFLKHLLGGIQYAIGKNEHLDYSKAKSLIPPDADRFSKNSLAFGEFFEPTEMAVLPNRDVLIAQRRGELLLYKHETKKVSQVGFLDVYHRTLNSPGVNAEEGFMGLQKDPNFEENNWIYVFYSPTGDKWVNRLSRFTFKDDALDMSSEKVILDVDSQREICCHTGGSIAFGGDGLLYLSTGDNSTPFNEEGVKYVNNGYAPLNDIPGRQQYDARRSSGNTNDLRGKILRIKVNDDGTYDIPEGNLFPEGTAKTRPEIYTMGHRNPYRISVDQKNGFVYWGDIGPDSRVDSLETRGPRGYDEVGQARKAGNFGWPLFIADNKPYYEYDYSKGESGAIFDPENPLNTSKNNTGLQELPKAMPAYLWYPYGDSEDFPQLTSGGRNAMAGPVYYTDLYPKETALPEYYDGKLIIYDWMRGWMMAVSQFPNGDFNKMEPFAPEVKVNSLIDMEVGPEGRIYLLEYGSGWFAKNENAGLSFIDYNGGNRPPVIEEITVDKTSGQLPLTIKATVDARDREKDEVTYIWDLGNGTSQETTTPEISHTFDKVGEYKIQVTVKDTEGAEAKSDAVTVVAGNDRPEINIDILSGNASFFISGQAVNYKVSVTDSDGQDQIDPSNIYVSVDYLQGLDGASLSLGHQQVSAAITGKALTESMDCKACHKEAEKSIGPNYLEISQKYKDNPNGLAYLQQKIVEGGSGVWGEVTMPAHPNISSDETRQISLYIQSLAAENQKKKSLPPSGTIMPKPATGDNLMVITASYTDNGNNGAKPLTGVKSVSLKSSTINFSNPDNIPMEGFTPISFNGMDLLVLPGEGGWFALKDIDLTGVRSAMITVAWQDAPVRGVDFEMRLNAPDGKLLGKGSMPTPLKGQPGGAVFINMESEMDVRAEEIYFVYTLKEGQEPLLTPLVAVNVNFNGK